MATTISPQDAKKLARAWSDADLGGTLGDIIAAALRRHDEIGDELRQARTGAEGSRAELITKLAAGDYTVAQAVDVERQTTIRHEDEARARTLAGRAKDRVLAD